MSAYYSEGRPLPKRLDGVSIDTHIWESNKIDRVLNKCKESLDWIKQPRLSYISNTLILLNEELN